MPKDKEKKSKSSKRASALQISKLPTKPFKEKFNKLKEIAETNSLGCLIVPGNGKRLSKQVTIEKGDKHYCYITHIALAASRNKDLEKIVKAEKKQDMEDIWEASHLCHHPRCINPDHIIIETRLKNLHRNMCVGHCWIKCKCGDYNSPCAHEPSCLLPRDKKVAEEIWKASQEN